MKIEEQDDLWKLLGQLEAPQPSPFFSRNVLRSIREEAQEKPGFFSWLHRYRQLAALGACAILFAAGVAMTRTADQPDPVLALAEEVSISPDYQVISNLDELLDTERNSIWLEASIN